MTSVNTEGAGHQGLLSLEGRDVPWAFMGRAYDGEDKITTVDQALEYAGLDYTVETVPVQAVMRPAPGRESGVIHLNAFRATMRVERSGRVEPMGVVGRRFTVTQNLDAFGWTQYLVDEFGCSFAGAADYAKGTRSLLVLRMPDDLNLDTPDGGQDVLRRYLFVSNAHDGSAALRVWIGPLRLACTNALRASFREAEQTWTFAHTPKASERLVAAQESIRKAVAWDEQFQVAAQKMLDTPMTGEQFRRRVLDNLLPLPREGAGDKAVANVTEKRDALRDLFGGPANANIAGTAWAAYNAVTEFVDWVRPVRGKDATLARAEGALDGPYTRMKDRAFSILAKV